MRYSLREAEAQHIVLKKNLRKGDHSYVYHANIVGLGTVQILLLTTRAIMCFDARQLNILWRWDLSAINLEDSNINLGSADLLSLTFTTPRGVKKCTLQMVSKFSADLFRYALLQTLHNVENTQQLLRLRFQLLTKEGNEFGTIWMSKPKYYLEAFDNGASKIRSKFQNLMSAMKVVEATTPVRTFTFSNAKNPRQHAVSMSGTKGKDEEMAKFVADSVASGLYKITHAAVDQSPEGTMICYEKKKKRYATYGIKVTAISEKSGRQFQWTVYRRYSQFRSFVIQLKAKVLLDKLPRKKVKKTASKIIQERKATFADIVATMVRLGMHTGSDAVQNFLMEKLCRYHEINADSAATVSIDNTEKVLCLETIQESDDEYDSHT